MKTTRARRRTTLKPRHNNNKYLQLLFSYQVEVPRLHSTVEKEAIKTEKEPDPGTENRHYLLRRSTKKCLRYRICFPSNFQSKVMNQQSVYETR